MYLRIEQESLTAMWGFLISKKTETLSKLSIKHEILEVDFRYSVKRNAPLRNSVFGIRYSVFIFPPSIPETHPSNAPCYLLYTTQTRVRRAGTNAFRWRPCFCAAPHKTGCC